MIPQKAFSFESAFESAKKNVEMVKTMPKKHLQDFRCPCVHSVCSHIYPKIHKLHQLDMQPESFVSASRVS
jgi:hypothetical protein